MKILVSKKISFGIFRLRSEYLIIRNLKIIKEIGNEIL